MVLFYVLSIAISVIAGVGYIYALIKKNTPLVVFTVLVIWVNLGITLTELFTRGGA